MRFNFWRKSITYPDQNTFPNLSRTRVIDGKLIPAFIHNHNYFFVNLAVYEDGSIDCWDFTDLSGFKKRLESGWVKTFIPDNESISVYLLGSWEISNGNWQFNQDNFYDFVESIVKTLNPQMVNLYTPFGKKIKGQTIFESGVGKLYKDINPEAFYPERLSGDSIFCFYKEKGKFYLINLVVYADGKIEFLNLPVKVETDFQNLQSLVNDGKVFSQIPLHSTVEVYGLGNFTVTKENFSVTMENKILEIGDFIEELNGKDGSMGKCRKIFAEYLENPTIELRENLKTAYEKVPQHKRRFLGDMSTKDIPIRMIIYGDDEVKKWSHYQAAEMTGERLPSIKVPKPEDSPKQ